MTILHAVTLPIELTNGNDGRTQKWFNSAKRRREYEQLLIFTGHNRKPFPMPVGLVVVRILGKGQRLWDADSGLRGSWKEIQDALVAVGWFVDDSARYIEWVQFSQDKTQRDDGPAVRVIVCTATEDTDT